MYGFQAKRCQKFGKRIDEFQNADRINRLVYSMQRKSGYL